MHKQCQYGYLSKLYFTTSYDMSFNSTSHEVHSELTELHRHEKVHVVHRAVSSILSLIIQRTDSFDHLSPHEQVIVCHK